MWTTQPIEIIAEERLLLEQGAAKGKEIFALYLSARNALVWQVLPDIKRVLPDHSDHGADHIANVLGNAGKLLRVNDPNEKMSGLDLYCLILSILFHDSGNVYGRKDHQKQVASIYDFACPEPTRDAQEKYIVTEVTAAHTGEARDGTHDTLKSVDQETPFYDGSVRLRDIAAIVRFADELAEGPQRTSLFMQRVHEYSDDSQIHHAYARVTKVTIDVGNERIALTYNIKIDVTRAEDLVGGPEAELRQLLEYIYARIDKVNQERKYARHYCSILAPITRVTIAFNFWINGERKPLGLTEQLTLTDLVVPGDRDKHFLEFYAEYEVESVMGKIRQHI